VKKIILIFIIILIVCVVTLGLSYQALFDWGKKSNQYQEEIIIELKPKTSLRNFSKILEEQKVVSKALLFEAWVRLFSNYRTFQAGRYYIKGEYSIELIIKKIQSGETYNPVLFTIAVPEGFTLAKIIERMVSNNIGTYNENFELANSIEFLQSLNISASSIEGYLYPATYPFTEIPAAKDIYSLMVNTFWDNLPTGYLEKIKEFGLDLHQAVTFASLIELETLYDFERSQVSEVIWNRLNKRMPLGIDASIIYGVKDYQGDLTFNHLKDASNLYNTRIHLGLPPGPIGSPSRDSLLAVINPSKEGNYYYVLDYETKKHIFTKSLNEHSKLVRKLIQDQKK
jgi:UPF0755 protein